MKYTKTPVYSKSLGGAITLKNITNDDKFENLVSDFMTSRVAVALDDMLEHTPLMTGFDEVDDCLVW
jgi:hypothetical protein